MTRPLRVMICDDHLIVREGLRLILETEPGFELIGEASDGNEALRVAAELDPELILMDLRMPDMDGLTAIERLQVEQPQIAVVFLTTYNEYNLMIRGLRAGASGYLLKDTDRQTLFNTIRAAARGETLLQPDILSRVLTPTEKPLEDPTGLPTHSVRGDNYWINLTEREREVLDAVARGERNKEIAYHLGISERTVKAHLASIYKKFDVDSRAAAIAIAAQHGLLRTE